MSFLQKAREAASNAAEQARVAAEQARLKATDPSTQERLRQGMHSAGESARQAGSAARRGLSNMVDRIDPGVLAEVVIKATALQERANASLRAKGSPYRIAEVQITATLPPQVGFSISRVGDIEEILTGHEIDSSQLVPEALGPGPDDATDESATLIGLEAAPDDPSTGEAALAETTELLP